MQKRSIFFAGSRDLLARSAWQVSCFYLNDSSAIWEGDCNAYIQIVTAYKSRGIAFRLRYEIGSAEGVRITSTAFA